MQINYIRQTEYKTNVEKKIDYQPAIEKKTKWCPYSRGWNWNWNREKTESLAKDILFTMGALWGIQIALLTKEKTIQRFSNFAAHYEFEAETKEQIIRIGNYVAKALAVGIGTPIWVITVKTILKMRDPSRRMNILCGLLSATAPATFLVAKFYTNAFPFIGGFMTAASSLLTQGIKGKSG